MVKKSLLIAILSFALGLTSCGSSGPSFSYTSFPDTGEEIYENDDVGFVIDSVLNFNGGHYNMSCSYSDNYFLKDAKNYDKSLAELSFASSTVTVRIDRALSFLGECHFKDPQPIGYEDNNDKDCAYFLAHKPVKEYELFTVQIRGFDYGREWASNFRVGNEGDHEGFYYAASKVYKELNSYINRYRNGKKIKLWINGYSRAGAISNVLSSLILRNNTLSINPSDMYVYTFEAPRGLTKEHAINYENVHNIINHDDFITCFAPEKYELYRCGVDVDVYSSNVSNILSSFDEEILIPEYKVIEVTDELGKRELNNDEEYLEFVYKCAFDNGYEDDQELLANTRGQYVTNYQKHFETMFDIFFSLSLETRLSLVEDLGKKDRIAILSILISGTGMVNFLEPYLKKDNIDYNRDGLIYSFDFIRESLFTTFHPLLTSVLDSGVDNFYRMISTHMPEVSYNLMMNYHKNIK